MTAVLYYPLNPATGFHFMLNCFFLYNYSLRLETDQFKQKPGDYFFLLFFNWILCVLIGLVIDLPVSNMNTRLLFLERTHGSNIVLIIDFDGPDGSFRPVCLVQTEQGCHCELHVRHSLQGHVLAVDLAGNGCDSFVGVGYKI